MARDFESKINYLHGVAPKGSPLTTAWLQRHGVSVKLAWWYVKSGWFERIADGLYRFAKDNVTWAGAVSAAQQQMGLPIYPGAKTALQLLGRGHYISKELQDIQLFAPSKTKSPGWLQASYWKKSLTLYRPNLFEKIKESWLTTIEADGVSLTISSPEKAALELCFLIPNSVTFVEAALIIEGLPNMRPKLLQDLLECCESYKVKRLLLYFGDHFEHTWMNEINLERIDLGKGRRVIAGGGSYDAKYQISVPILRGDT